MVKLGVSISGSIEPDDGGASRVEKPILNASLHFFAFATGEFPTVPPKGSKAQKLFAFLLHSKEEAFLSGGAKQGCGGGGELSFLFPFLGDSSARMHVTPLPPSLDKRRGLS